MQTTLALHVVVIAMKSNGVILWGMGWNCRLKLVITVRVWHGQTGNSCQPSYNPLFFSLLLVICCINNYYILVFWGNLCCHLQNKKYNLSDNFRGSRKRKGDPSLCNLHSSEVLKNGAKWRLNGAQNQGNVGQVS